MAELKPCPFCGNTHPYIRKGKYMWMVCCINADCGAYGGVKHYKKEAIEAWNRRTENEELKFTREFIHEHGLEYALASAWNRRAEDVV